MNTGKILAQPDGITVESILALPSGTYITGHDIAGDELVNQMWHRPFYVWAGPLSDFPGDFTIVSEIDPSRGYRHIFSHATNNPPRRIIDNATENFLRDVQITAVIPPDHHHAVNNAYDIAAWLASRYRISRTKNNTHYCICEYDFADRMPGASREYPDLPAPPIAVDPSCPRHAVKPDHFGDHISYR